MRSGSSQASNDLSKIKRGSTLDLRVKEQASTHSTMRRSKPSSPCLSHLCHIFNILMVILLLVIGSTYAHGAEMLYGNSCQYELENLSEDEKEKTIEWLDKRFGEGQYTSLYNCRIALSQIVIAIVPPRMPKAELYLLAPENLSSDVSPIPMPEVDNEIDWVPLSILMDKGKHLHLLERHSSTHGGVMRTRYMLINLKTQKRQLLAEGQEDGESGGCNRHEFLEMDIAEYVDIETKDFNGDSLNDIGVTIRKEICASGSVSKVRRLFYAGKNGFSATR